MRFILLRGLGRDQLHWKPLLEKIKEAWPDANIETPDLPGAGILHRTTSPLSLEDYIPFLKSQLSDSSEPATLIGLSLGGMIALTWAKLFPSDFNQLVVINTSSRLSPLYSRLKLYKAIYYPGAVIRVGKRIKERAIYQLTCNTRPVDEAIVDEWADIQRMHPVKITNQIRQIWAGLKFTAPPADAIPEVCVIYSKKDGLVSPRCSQDLIKFYKTKYYVHQWAGHDLPQDDPEWLVCQLKHLLQ